MPYLIESTNNLTRAQETGPFGPEFTPAETANALTMEIWGSSACDPGGDYVDFKLMDAAGNVVATRRMPGY